MLVTRGNGDLGVHGEGRHAELCDETLRVFIHARLTSALAAFHVGTLAHGCAVTTVELRLCTACFWRAIVREELNLCEIDVSEQKDQGYVGIADKRRVDLTWCLFWRTINTWFLESLCERGGVVVFVSPLRPELERVQARHPVGHVCLLGVRFCFYRLPLV